MEENEATLISQSGVARLLNVRSQTVCELARCWRLEPRRMSNGRAFGVDAAGLAVLAAALNRPIPAAPVPPLCPQTDAPVDTRIGGTRR
jgi:hypothetical protein